MAITNATEIQAWINSYTFVDNGTTSRDILSIIVPNFSNHGFRYGPTLNGGYTLSINGPVVTQDFVIKEDN
jgi:hypothetical protein